MLPYSRHSSGRTLIKMMSTQHLSEEDCLISSLLRFESGDAERLSNVAKITQ